MARSTNLWAAPFCALILVAGAALAKPLPTRQEFAPGEALENGLVGEVDGRYPLPAKAAEDTVWIADWSFDAANGGCDDTGWTKIDNRILNDGSNYWHIDTTFNGTNGIVDNAAILSKHDLCWVSTSGYGNMWDYAIVLKYRGASTLSFNLISDSEPGFDFVTVEADSAGASEARVDYNLDPTTATASEFRTQLLSITGIKSTGSVSALVLPDFGVPATTHEAYIRFNSETAYSDEDGYYPTLWGAGLVVDNIAVTGSLTYTENFESSLNVNVSLVNSALALPFGEWARLFKHITDNDKCTENTTCAWLWSDPLRIALFPDMAFGPGSAVIHSWLDDIIVGPWVSLVSTPSATGTVLSMRRCGAQSTAKSNIVQNWSVRSQRMADNTDTSALGDSIQCISSWGHAYSFNAFSSYTWGTNVWDMTSYLRPSSTDIQLRLRVADAALPYFFGTLPPATYDPGPGPYNDRIRIGRRILTGPTMNVGIDTRTQLQECFPTEIFPGKTYYRPNTDTSAPLYPYLFGTCAFSLSTDLGINKSSVNLIVGDSIYVPSIVDARNVGGIRSVKLYGAITEGPHAGKAPVPWSVGPNGFFAVQADSAKGSSGVWIANAWFVDLDDTYFRGGDKFVYFWYATDAGGGGASLPSGIAPATFPPASVTDAENLTRGLYEANYLPTINWDPAYVARVQADANGDLAPNAAEVANSSQRNCILYYQHAVSTNRRSGEINRTMFMYALDQLGYRSHYDVYDNQGYGNTNNQLGGRATVPQASGYALIIMDNFRGLSADITDGIDLDAQKINQALWFRNYLAQGLTGRAGTASLWIFGEDCAYEKSINPLISTDFGLVTVVNDQAIAISPNVTGVGSATTWDNCTIPFAGDQFALAGGCPAFRDYDGASATAGAVITHKYQAGTVFGTGAIVMNKNTTLHWNTVWMGFGFNDIRNTQNVPGHPDPSIQLMQKMLACLLPLNCRRSPGVTDAGGDETSSLPRVSALYQNTPNPFNPATTIHFDLAREGHVELRIYDAAGRAVKTLVNGSLAGGRNLPVTWNGMNDSGNRVPSGIYFYKLVTVDLTATKKMVLLK
jgi:hypothetical protein